METISNAKELTYEQAMEALEMVVRQLDNGELPLEDAITSFQNGLEYIKVCQEKLTAAEGKLAMFRNGQFEVQ
ncbi:MAG: exodeoxyribonuclease VII small subunit [Peptococcaceae bacterium]|jgi:exodeoxyribonuclease VII small subunit|nr:exodeoxyribonuclease VII small subunit [Peptococcaceae bacterium]MBQ2004457.1 exodeoxyribonuclease VII small subunit [Peptococcaceae bacterium]MBQ2021801.1 exodeoxyribonuclease VII small subunit [Peptococcaceae bacterium]MBQ2369444.1 exodeoxyribonuclease VII small subunit [Peptococcaceae bacterium]MBQ2432278.1 exodeoxyribonuclease VII small subunit [Peptococcaceae bacterium]